MLSIRPHKLSAALAALVAALALAAASSDALAQRDRDSEAELRQKLENYVRTLGKKQSELTEAAAAQKKAELETKAAQVRYNDATKLIEKLNVGAGDARRAATDAGRTAQEIDARLRDRVDDLPEVAEAAEKFHKIDHALQRIADTIAAPIRAGDAYKALEQKRDALRQKREIYAQSDAVDPAELTNLAAQEQSADLDMRQMLNEALSASDEYRHAQSAADAAAKELGLLRDRHAAAVAADPSLTAARDTVAAAKELVAQKTQALAEAREVQADARTDGKRASAIYANATQRVNALQTEIKQLEGAIAQMRHDLRN